MASYLTYNCDVCRNSIPPLNPRVHCLDPSCPDFDLCANCALGEKFTPPHAPGHQTKVFRTAGGGAVTTVEGSWYVHASAIAAATSSRTFSPTGAAPALPLRSTASGPPPLPSRRLLSGSNTNEGATSSMPAASNGREAQQGPGSPPQPSPTSGWQPFFNADSSPSPAFVTLMNDIFSYLDPTNVGNLVPETFSKFLDDMGYLPHENAWKAGLTATLGCSAESMADKSLKNAFDLFSIDHILLQRRQQPQVNSTGITAQFSRAFGSSMLGSSAITSPGPMPAITRVGFVEIMRVEALSDPSREWGNFSRLLRKYNLSRYRSWGDLPRTVLPDVPDAAMLQRVAGVNAFAQRKAQEMVNAAKVEAQIRAQGREAALDLLTDTRRVEYRYV